MRPGSDPSQFGDRSPSSPPASRYREAPTLAATALGLLEEARLAYTAALELDDENETDAEDLLAELG